MAFFTVNFDMLAFQRVSGAVMIKLLVVVFLPTGGGMAFGTVRAKPIIMYIFVAIGTGIKFFKFVGQVIRVLGVFVIRDLFMAILAFNLGV
jgi:hypothetical protein